MRSLKKNKSTLYYALYNEKKEIVDENGDFTGEYIVGYSAPEFFNANLSAGKGSAQADIFGVNVDFTRTISTTDLSLPITETSLVWYETEPKLLKDGTADPDSADYKVAAPPAAGLNELVIALKARAKNV
ncbi:hypothetical protein DWX41_20865 [Hungatella hathewayi]|uniref:Uncharacterized protein n=1 Tax=Hungatella hathewayi TaxID=154046 RepID=A0A3E2WG33_9FIRM|nr:hypothetical protein [Hungatella hathewayi]RGC24864.1 hypothetical protein DWX41_20865 [Hungatella hathewayi]